MDFKKRIKTGFAAMLLVGGFWTVSNVYGGPPAGAGADPTKTAPSSSEAAASPDDKFEKELRQLRQLVELQQSRINELESKVNGAKEAAPAAPPVIASTSVTGVGLNLTGRAKKQETLTSKTENSNSNQSAGVGGVPAGSPAMVAAAIPAAPKGAGLEDVAHKQELLSKKVDRLEGKVKGFGPFTFSGDIRLRGEPFFGGPSNQSQVRDRERFRLRFNVNAKLNDDINGGFSEASGDINDPTTTNQTITEFYTRKAFNLDKAFINYHPHQLKYLTLTGGKFAYPWYNTELTWDKDLNPEGLAQTLAFKLDSTPVLKKVAFVGFELPFAEVAGVSVNDKRIAQSVTYGGQIQTTWQFAKWLKLSAYSGFYNFHNSDPIALALAKANAKSPQTPDTGLLPLGTGNTVQNSIVTTTATNVVTIDSTSYPTGVTSISNAQFASKFGLLDSLARFDITTRSEKWPVAFIGDFVQNTEACANVGNILAAPANTSSVHYTQSTNFACNSHQRRAYWGEALIGRAERKGDLQFDYARIFIEREAVLSNFNYSDIRQGSNVTQHRAMIQYQADRNIQLAFTALIGRPLNFGSSTPPENWLERLQFDVIYKF